MAQPKRAGSAAEPERLPFDAYEVVEMARTELKDAPYNPRRISAAARLRLKKAIGKHKLVAPPTWNKRSGNIVGGHKRIATLDALHGSPHYTLKVAVVDVDDKTEKELNLLLNNDEAQGEDDLEKQAALLREVDLEGAGFDASSAYRMFGDAVVTGDNANEFAKAADEMAERSARIDAAVRKDPDNPEFYLVFVAPNAGMVDAFVKAHGLDDNTYQPFEILAEAFQRNAEVNA